MKILQSMCSVVNVFHDCGNSNVWYVTASGIVDFEGITSVAPAAVIAGKYGIVESHAAKVSAAGGGLIG